MTIKVGDRIPSATLVKADAEGPQPVDTDDYFAGRKVALFSVPGAFTPTCSARHLPGFVEKADELKAKGVDEVACVAVNDAFVLQAWARNRRRRGQGDDARRRQWRFRRGARPRPWTSPSSAWASAASAGRRSSTTAWSSELNVEEPGAFSVSSAEFLLGQL